MKTYVNHKEANNISFRSLSFWMCTVFVLGVLTGVVTPETASAEPVILGSGATGENFQDSVFTMNGFNVPPGTNRLLVIQTAAFAASTGSAQSRVLPDSVICTIEGVLVEAPLSKGSETYITQGSNAVIGASLWYLPIGDNDAAEGQQAGFTVTWSRNSDRRVCGWTVIGNIDQDSPGGAALHTSALTGNSTAMSTGDILNIPEDYVVVSAAAHRNATGTWTAASGQALIWNTWDVTPSGGLKGGSSYRVTSGQETVNLQISTTGAAGVWAMCAVGFKSKYRLNVAANPVGHGNAYIGAESGPTSGDFDFNATPVIVAVPNTGYAFSVWSGVPAGTVFANSNAATTTVSMAKNNRTATANFDVAVWTLTTGVNNSAGGSVSPGGTYLHNSTAAVTATVNAGYYFAGWSGDASGRSNPVDVVMDEDKSVTANLLPKTSLTLVGLSAQDKTYDGNDTATIDTYGTLSPVAGGDTVYVVTTSAVARFSDKNAASDKLVTVTGLSLGGADAYKYSLADQTAHADIGVRPLTLNDFNANSKTYDGNATVTGIGFSDDRIAGDILTFSCTASFADKNAGVDKPVNYSSITISGGSDAGNYTLATVSGTAFATIWPRILTLSAFTADDKPYDGNTNASGLGFSDNRLGSDELYFSYTAAFADKNIGVDKPVNYAGITISGGADGNNYTLASAIGTAHADITAIALSLPGLTAEDKIYDRSTGAIVSEYGTLAGVIGTENVTLVTTAAVANFASRNTGDHPVTVTGLSLGGPDAGNYTIGAQTTAATAAIAPKSLDVAGIVVKNKIYDGLTTAEIGSFGSLVGVIAGDVVSVDHLSAYAADFDTAEVGTDKAVTITGLVLAGVDKNNYSFTGPWYATASIFASAHTIVASVIGAGGSIEPSGDVLVEAGKDQVFEITADNNYAIDEVLVDGTPVPGAAGEVAYDHTFTAVSDDHTISVSFDTVVEIMLNGGDITLECGGTYEEQGAIAVDGGGSPLDVDIDSSALNVSTAGVYAVVYRATDGVNIATATRQVTVEDTAAPVLQAGPDLTLECNLDAYEEDVSAWDACDGILTDQVEIAGQAVNPAIPDTYEVLYSVSDGAGHEVTGSRTITVEDTTAPVITLQGDNPLEMVAGNDYFEAGYTATDLCGGDLTGDVTITGNDFNTDEAGLYTITYAVSDSHGNEDSIARVVIVKPVGCSMSFSLDATPNPAISGVQVRFSVVELPGSCSVGLLQYEWKWRAENGGVDFVPVPGAENLSEYVIEKVGFPNAGTYICTVSDASDSFETAPVVLVVESGIPATGLFGMMLLIALTAAGGTKALHCRRLPFIKGR